MSKLRVAVTWQVIFLQLVIYTAGVNIYASPRDFPDYSIARWRGFKKAAYSITFDDNYRFQVLYAAPVLNQHNYKATFFLVTNRVGQGWAPGWDTVNMLASQGHEIASHSKNHPNFITLSQHPEWTDSMVHEFRDSRDTINSRVPSQSCETFAWPGGYVNQVAGNASKDYYMACRGSVNGFEGPLPFDFYDINSQFIYHDTQLQVVDGYIDTILSRKGWLVERWHGFQYGNDTNGYEPVPITIFINHINHVALFEDSLWITTLDSVVKYIRERQSSVVSLVDSSGSTILLSLSNDLQNIPYNYNVPLSLKLRMYGKMQGVTQVIQAGNVIPFIVTHENGCNYMNFDAIPNIGLIELHLFPVGLPKGVDLQDHAICYPNPFQLSSDLLFDITEPQNVEILLFSPAGLKVQTYKRYCLKGLNSLRIDGNLLFSGTYTCLIRTSRRTMTLKMIRK
ncbi:MAG: polysaccharide deacetylase family protein [Bacteroidota bacterium]